jgi:hypothetical protein
MTKRNMLLICGITACLASTAYADHCAKDVTKNLRTEPYKSLFDYIRPITANTLHDDLRNLHRALLGETVSCGTALNCYNILLTDTNNALAPLSATEFPNARLIVADANGNVAVDTANGTTRCLAVGLPLGTLANSLACYTAGMVSLNLLTDLGVQEAENYICGWGTDTQFDNTKGPVYQHAVAIRMGYYQHSVGTVRFSRDVLRDEATGAGLAK